jgi:signal transduction histidine kinase
VRSQRLAWGLLILSAALVAAAALVDVAAHRRGVDIGEADLAAAAGALGFPLVGALVARREPRNAIGWILLASGVVTGSIALAEYGAAWAELGGGASGTAADVALWWAGTGFIGGPPLCATVAALVLFPSGRAEGRWRRLGIGALVVAIAVVWVVGWLGPGALGEHFRSLDNPFGVDAFDRLDPLVPAGAAAVLAIAVGAAVAQVRRLGRARGDERQQLKWFLSGCAVACVAFVATWIWWGAGGHVRGPIAAVVVGVGLTAVPIGLGTAILRYRLYEVDALLLRSLVAAAVAAVLVGAYAGILAVVGSVRGSGPGLGASLLAVVPVALLFAPARRAVQRRVERRLWGEPGDPYAAVADLGRRLADAPAPEDVLPHVAEAVTRALRVPACEVELLEPDGPRTAARYGPRPVDPVVLPLTYAGSPVGRLIVDRHAPGADLSSADRRTLAGLAHQAAVAAHGALLARELEASRGRVALAREEERRRLRRDLHDGLGPALAGMALQLESAARIAGRDPSQAHALVGEVRGEVRAALADIRRLVDGLRPPALDELGLVGAIERRAESFAPLRTEVRAPEPIAALPAAVEVAAYRIAVEALTNVARHANASRCTVSLSLNGGLRIEVADDGDGLPELLRPNVGLMSMRERATELGGELTVGVAAGGGTRLLAHLPLPTEPS